MGEDVPRKCVDMNSGSQSLWKSQPDKVVHICNPNAPLVKGMAELGKSMEPCKAASLANAGANKKS